MKNKQLSPERKFMFVAGNIIAGVGVLLFLSTFVTAAFSMGSSHQFDSMEAGFQRAAIGMIMIFVGSIVHGIGRSGLAGSGILPDPEQMREDLKPWNKAAGQMTNDTLSEIGLVQKLEGHLEKSTTMMPPPPPLVKIRCQSCQSLNDETAKFCNNCGTKI